MHFQSESEAAKKRTELRALETLLTFKSAFDDDFEQLRSNSLKDGKCLLEFSDERSHVWHLSQIQCDSVFFWVMANCSL
jgi:hypothetical protein